MTKPDTTPPPLMKRWFGPEWENLEGKEDFWNRWFGPDNALDLQLAREAHAPMLDKRGKVQNSSQLSNPGWIKETLDNEVLRYVTEDLGLVEDTTLLWKRTKLALVAVLFAVLAQFPYFFPKFTPELQKLDALLVALCYTAGLCVYWLGRGTPNHALFETQSGLYVLTELTPRYGTDYEITIQSKAAGGRKEGLKKAKVSATHLFTPSSKLCPEPLHAVLKDLLQ